MVPVQSCTYAKAAHQISFRLNLLRLCAEDAALPTGSRIVQENVLICLQNKELRSPRLNSPIRWQQMQQHLQIARSLLQRQTRGLDRAQEERSAKEKASQNSKEQEIPVSLL